MTEVVTVHIGQAGVQAALPLWELYCREQNVPLMSVNREGYQRERDSTFFVEKFTKLSPRAALIDLDSSSVDNVRSTTSGAILFSPEFCVTGGQDAGSLFPRGYQSYNSRKVVQSATERLRKLCEPLDNFHGFNIQHALGGGTGSGFGTLLLNKLTHRYRKKPMIQFTVYPSEKMSTSVVEPYNTILATAFTDESDKCCCVVDNESLYHAIQNRGDFRNPDLKDINWLWSYAISGVTASIRHGGTLDCRLSDICTNMVPYPSVRYPMLTYNPVMGKTSKSEKFTVSDLVMNCFHPDKQLFNVDLREGVYTSCCLMVRGEASPHEVNDTLKELRGNGSIPLTDWSPCGMKVSLCSNAPTEAPSSFMRQSDKAASALLSSTAVSQSWKNLHGKYKILLSKRSFLHWYTAEGMDYDQFLEASEYMNFMLDRYIDVV